MGIFQELKRRNVFRVGIAYVVLSWLLLQVTDVVVPILELPDWVAKFVLFLLLLGFPLVLFFAWAYELTPEGLKREKDVDRSQSITARTGKKLDRAIIAILAIAVAMLLVDRFLLGTSPVSGQQVSGMETGDKSVAVLPFVAMSSGPDDEFFADGLTEEILNSLAQLPELLVTARTSAFAFKEDTPPVAEVAEKLGVQHVVEGSVRRSGDRLRVTAQLIRATDEFHLWSQNYDSSSADAIAVQEDIAEQIATALDVVLDDEKRQSMQRAGLRDVEAFIEYQKAYELYEGAHGGLDQIPALRQANEHYTNVLARVPNFGPAYLNRSDLYIHILNNDVSGLSNPGVTEEEVANAHQNAIDEYTKAVANARNSAERVAWEYDLAVISGNWRGLAGRADRVLDSNGCINVNWLNPYTAVFGRAREYLGRTEELLACNPLYSIMWLNRVRAAMWSGDPGLAVAIAEDGSRVAASDWLDVSHALALVAAGRFDEAEEIVSSRIQSSIFALYLRVLVAAAKGDAKAAAERFMEYREDPAAGEFYGIQISAWTGDREAANRIAALIDQHPFRHHVLTLVAYWCACGAPFDLEVTPNYAANLEQAGFAWPPPSPIKFPLKDW
ncbi:MAG: hypothetical protein GWN47_07555 [Woeseiaceae bacterium]|nr:hypothetical protein [Woeseiaceae bacterium]